MSIRAVVIDDTDPVIRYTGSGWTSDIAGSQDEFGTYGKTYNHTLHATSANDTFAFSFQGSSIRVFGTINLAPTYGYSVVSGPDFRSPWECFVDSTSIGAVKPSLFHENNWLLCDGPQLADGAHELTVKITMRNGTTFWLDYLQYTPSRAPSDKAVLLVENTDPAISYDASWRVSDHGLTNTQGAQMKFNFTGTQLTWMGYVPIEFPGNTSSGSYLVDNGPLTSFSLIGHAPFDGTSLFNQAFFTTPELSNGPHSIAVTYNGNAEHTPLTLDYIYLTVLAGVSSVGPAVISGTPLSGGTPRRTSVGAVIGGTLGGITVVAIVVFLVLFVRRRQSRDPSKWQSGRPSGTTVAVPFPPTQQPSSTGLNNVASEGFVSGVMAQIGNKKQVGAQEIDLPTNTIISSDVPPRYSAI